MLLSVIYFGVVERIVHVESPYVPRICQSVIAQQVLTLDSELFNLVQSFLKPSVLWLLPHAA